MCTGDSQGCAAEGGRADYEGIEKYRDEYSAEGAAGQYEKSGRYRSEHGIEVARQN